MTNARRVLMANFYYATGGSFIEMQIRPGSTIPNQFLINQTLFAYCAQVQNPARASHPRLATATAASNYLTDREGLLKVCSHRCH
jgi:hypothetical protein